VPAVRAIEAELTWVDGAFAPGVRVEVDEDGRIARVSRAAEGRQGEDRDALRLPGRALVPGLVDAHSHAFQRGLRGRGESFPRGAGSFWTWREAMYGLVERLDGPALRALCLQAFREMRAAGITAVGEFHYLHHSSPEQPDWALDELVLTAAAEAGIRLVLLETYYRTGGFGQPLEGAQRRFGAPSPAAYWEQMDRLAARLDPRTQSLGAVVHSLRAASLDDLAAVYDEARRRELPFHIHIEEQRREIEESLAFYGKRPIELLWQALGTATDLTAVHCTHTTREDLQRFVAAGGTVCICPLTEGNLGDGLPDLSGLPELSGALCLGSDSNARISMLEEMRWLEYGQRLRGQMRGGLPDAQGDVAPVLWSAATEGGARALGLAAGAIAPGRWADFAAIDLAAPALAGWTPETLLASLVFGAGDGVIAATCVGGEWEEGAR
jgi:formimidoylglutamate deiminase